VNAMCSSCHRADTLVALQAADRVKWNLVGTEVEQLMMRAVCEPEGEPPNLRDRLAAWLGGKR
jgi:hypothetical protein